MGNTPTLTQEQWNHYATRQIEFVSGAGEGEVEPGHLTDMIYGIPEYDIAPKIPNELIPIAERVEFEGIDAEAVKKMTPEERRDYQAFKTFVVADRLRKPALPRDAEDRPTADALRWVRLKMPTDDFQQVLEIALHMDYRERVMLRSFRELSSGPAGNGSGGHEGEASE